MPDDDRPPERIWLDDKALAAHFEGLRERYRGDDRGGDWQSIPEAEMQQNALTAQFRK